MSQTEQTKNFLEFKNIKKNYYENAVLKDISFSVAAGEIHGLIGENGAGKSTLMNILFGMPVIHSTGGYEGEVLINGENKLITSPKNAIEHGIGMVHQEFMLIPELSIFENIKLNKELTKRYFFNAVLPKKLEILDIKKMRKEAQIALKKVGLTIDELLPVAGLPVGHMQFIEIAREIDNSKIKLLVFDEPTAVLAESEADRLLKTMKSLAKDLNIAILFISHRLDEIRKVCDRVSVLRDGELVGTFDHENLDIPKMAELMVGRNVDLTFKAREIKVECSGTPKLELRDFSVRMPGERVNNINLSVVKGEILGIAGLAGQGKIGIANGIAGLFPASGEVLIDGKSLRLNCPKTSLESGIGFLCEDRRGTGLLLDESIEDNIALTAMVVQKKFLKKGWLKPFQFMDQEGVTKRAEEIREIFNLNCTNVKQMTRRLSGGNQQKVCIGRVLTTNPSLLMVSEPTRGVDIGAKELILQKVLQINREEDTTVLFTSSELLELRSVCDRIAIIADGKVVAILPPDAPDRLFGLAMAGDIEDLNRELGDLKK